MGTRALLAAVAASFFATASLADCEIVDMAAETSFEVIVASDRPATPDFVAGQIFVKLRSPAALSAILAAPPSLEALGDEVSLVVDPDEPVSAGLVAMNVVTFGFQSAESMKEITIRAAEELRKREDVEYVQINYILSTQAAITPKDPCYAFQWHYWENGPFSATTAPGGINLPKAWESGTGSFDVVVAVIDTGQSFVNSDLNPANFVQGHDFVDRDTDPTDHGIGTGWHGTHVSGTIGSLSSDNDSGGASSNWQVRIQPIRVLGNGGRGTLVDIANGILWASGIALAGVESNNTPARIVNLSLGGGPGLPCSDTPFLQDAIDQAVDRGVVVVVAAGNDNDDAAGFTPASCNGVITVAASDALGKLARYSNFGPDVEIIAPGGDTRQDANGDGMPDGVLSSVDSGVAFYNGTSMATPHVVGVAALLLATKPSLTPAEVEAQILDRVIPRSSTDCPRPCGKGLLNADLF